MAKAVVSTPTGKVIDINSKEFYYLHDVIRNEKIKTDDAQQANVVEEHINLSLFQDEKLSFLGVVMTFRACKDNIETLKTMPNSNNFTLMLANVRKVFTNLYDEPSYCNNQLRPFFFPDRNAFTTP